MASNNEKINLIISAKDRASKTLKGVQKNIVGIAAAYAAFRGISSILSSISDAGMEHEKVWTDVGAALQRHGHEVDSNIAKIQKFADEMQTLSGISDEAIGTSVQAFVDYGQTVSEAIETSRVAMDLAAGSGLSLKSATDLLAKAAVGYTSTLSRYGIIIDDNVPKAEKFATAIKLINDRFGGAAQARADTYAVKVALLAERFGDFQEQLFELLSPVFVGAMDALMLGVGELSRAVGDLMSWFDTDPIVNVAKELDNLNTEMIDLTGSLDELNTQYKTGSISIEEYAESYNKLLSQISTQKIKSPLREHDEKLVSDYKANLDKLLGFLKTGDVTFAQFDLAATTAAGNIARAFKTGYEDVIPVMDEFIAKAQKTVEDFAETTIFNLSPEGIAELAAARYVIAIEQAKAFDEEMKEIIRQRTVWEAGLLLEQQAENFDLDEEELEHETELSLKKGQILIDELNAKTEAQRLAREQTQELNDQMLSDAENLADDIVSAMAPMTNGLVDAMMGVQTDFARIFRQMAADFIKIFIQNSLKAFALSFFGNLFAGPLGGAAASGIGGGSQGFGFGPDNFGVAGNIVPQGNGTTVIINAPLMTRRTIEEEIVPQIERAISSGKSSIVAHKQNMTGAPNVMFT